MATGKHEAPRGRHEAPKGKHEAPKSKREAPKGKHEAPKKRTAKKAEPEKKETKKSAAKPQKTETKKTSKKTEVKTESTRKKERSSRSKKNAILAAVLIIVLIAAAALVGGMVIGRTAKIHPNMMLGDITVGDMTVDEAEKALDKGGWEAQSKSEVKVVLPGDYEFTVTSKDAGLEMNCREAAEAAYAYGHSGNPISDIKAYFRCITGKVSTSDVLIAASDEGIRTKVSDSLKEYGAILKQGYRLDLEAGTMKLVKGGENIDINADDLCARIIKAFSDREKTLNYTVEVTEANDVDFNMIHDNIYAEVVDAKYDTETRKVTESTVGVDFDVKQAEQIWNKAAPGELVEIKLKVTQPKYTSDELSKMLFRDKLGSQTTVYRSSAEGRATNVELSAASINDFILNPGEVFSYNDVVGKRTAERGYKTAGAYAGGKVVQEIGGGICQTSSTLYCAVLYANLEIVARDCHMFAVGYVPWGLDATVSWGGPEFKFKNNREFPIKIVTITKDRELTVEIWGTDVDGSYVEMDYSASTAYDSRYKDVAIGTKATTYRCVYDKDGNLISRELEDNSFYNYHEEDIRWPSPSPSASPAATENPAATIEETSLDP